MRKFMSPAVVGLSCVLALASGCEGLDNVVLGSTHTSNGTGTVGWSDGGANMTASGSAGVIATASPDGTFSIVAMNSTSHLSLNFVGITAAGTYSMGPGGAAAGSYQVGDAQWMSTVGDGSGTLTFTTLSATRAVGTFSFVGAPVLGTSATGDRTIGPGTFDITYP